MQTIDNYKLCMAAVVELVGGLSHWNNCGAFFIPLNDELFNYNYIQGGLKRSKLSKIVITSKPQLIGQWNKDQSADNTST